MTEYYAVIDDQGRTGPFQSMHEASRVLRETSRLRGYTDERAHQFFLNESSIIKVEDVHGQLESFNLGWLAREASGREEPSSETETESQESDQVKVPS
jgi:hypothetical protein